MSLVPSLTSQLEGLSKIPTFPTGLPCLVFPQILWDGICAFVSNLENNEAGARDQSNSKHRYCLVWILQPDTNISYVHQKKTHNDSYNEGKYFLSHRPKNNNNKIIKESQENWHIYLQTALGLVAITQKHKFFGTALIVYRFNLFSASEY